MKKRTLIRLLIEWDDESEKRQDGSSVNDPALWSWEFITKGMGAVATRVDVEDSETITI